MTNKPIANSECPNPKQCAEGNFFGNSTNRILWTTIEQNIVCGRQGVCYVFPPSVVICFSGMPRFVFSGGNVAGGSLGNLDTINRRKALHPKPGRWWEFWK